MQLKDNYLLDVNIHLNPKHTHTPTPTHTPPHTPLHTHTHTQTYTHTYTSIRNIQWCSGSRATGAIARVPISHGGAPLQFLLLLFLVIFALILQKLNFDLVNYLVICIKSCISDNRM